MAIAFVLIAGLAAGMLSGVTGTGSPIMLLPILVFQFGAKQAVPIMAIAALMANVRASELAASVERGAPRNNPTSKTATFRELGALPFPSILQGIIVGSVMAGAFMGRAIVLRLSFHAFQYLLDALLMFSGASLLWAAFD